MRKDDKIEISMQMYVTSFSSISYYSNLRLISKMLFEQRYLFYTYQSKMNRVKIPGNKNLPSILLHNKFDHGNKETLTLASSFSNFLWEHTWYGIQLKDAV